MSLKRSFVSMLIMMLVVVSNETLMACFLKNSVRNSGFNVLSVGGLLTLCSDTKNFNFVTLALIVEKCLGEICPFTTCMNVTVTEVRPKAQFRIMWSSKMHQVKP